MLSVIITFGGTKERRIRNLKETIKCIHNQTYQDYELILVEQKIEKDWCQEKFNRDIRIGIENTLNSNWNRSWGLNVGARESNSDNLLLMDGDVVFKDNYFEKVMENIDKFAFQGWSLCHCLTKKGTQKYFQEGITKELKDEEHRELLKKPEIKGSAGGINYYDKEFFFNNMGGLNEGMDIWGKEDNDMAFRISKLIGGHLFMYYEIFHLYHSKEELSSPEKNNQLWNMTQENPDEMTKILKDKGVGNKGNPIEVL